jgi:methionine synthase II (cobalamin-independent)
VPKRLTRCLNITVDGEREEDAEHQHPRCSKQINLALEGKMVVLGLVSTKHGALESKDNLKRRIDEEGKFVPLDQICLLPQCELSSSVEGENLTFDDGAAKLTLVVEAANEIWD